MSNWPSSKAKKVLTALQSIGWSVNGHQPQRQVDGGWVVVHSRRGELNDSQEQGQKHGHQRSIQVTYQGLAGVWELRLPAVAKAARERRMI
jgi:hypothetical protein